MDSIVKFYTIQVVEIKGGLERTPYPVTKISRRIIEENIGLTIEPILQTIPGIWMQSGAPNTNRISIRGIGNREPFATSKLRVYLGEIPITNGIGETSIEDIDPFLFESIEVWKSPTSALWGSGLGGMIQLKPAWNAVKKIQLSSQIGSFGTWNSSLAFRSSYGKEDQNKTILHGQFAKSDGYRENNNYQKLSGTWMQQIKISNKLQLSTFAHLIQLKAEIPSSLNLSDFINTPEKAASNWAAVNGNEDYLKGIFGFTLKYLINHQLTYQGTFFGNYFNSEEVRPFNVLTEKNISIGTRQKIVHSLNSDDYLSVGFELINENYAAQTFETLPKGIKGGPLSNEDESRFQGNFFIQYNKTILENIFLLVGGSYTITSQLGASNTFKQSSFNPTFGLNYLSQIEGLSFFSSYSNGFSPIALSNALDSDGKLNIELQPEKGWSVEAGLRYKTRNLKLNGSITGYLMRVRNLFVQKRIGPDQFIGSNAGKTNHNGFEIEMTYQPIKQLSYQMSYALSDHRFNTFIDGENNYSGNKLTGTAPHMLFQKVEIRFINQLPVILSHRFVSSTPINDGNTISSASFHIINTQVEYKAIKKDRLGLKLQLGIQNLFNTSYASMFQINAQGFGGAAPRYYYPGLPRNYFLKLLFELR